MLSVENRPLVLLALLAAGAFLCYVLPSGWRRTQLAIAVAALVGSLGMVANLASLAVSGPFTPLFEDAVAGVPLSLRVDGPGLDLAAISLVAALFALAGTDQRPSRETAVLTTCLGAVVAALGGNAVVLFAGAEVAAVGALLLHRAGRGRVSRSVLTAFAVQHALGLALLAAAVDLIVAVGTSDPYSLPPAAMGIAVAIPWGLAGAAWLLAGAWWPGSPAALGSTCVWLAVGAVPCGGAILLRLGAGLDGTAPTALTAVLSGVGLAAALGGGAAAWRWRSVSSRAGQSLLLAAAGLDVALSGVRGGSGAFAAGLLALELALLAAPAWSAGIGAQLGDRLGAAAALATTGWLPVGFGTTVLVLDLGSVAALGPGWAPLLVALGAAVAVIATATLAAAHRALAGPAPGGEPGPPLPGAALLALLGGGVGAVLPGGMVALAVTPLVGAGAPRVLDLASVSGPGGVWPGGYLTIAILVVGAAAGCVLLVAGRPIPAPAAEPRAAGGRPLWLPLIAPRRATLPALRRLASGLTALDSWLITQPGLVFAVAAAAVAILIFR
jgi:hypothetical protein